VKTQLFKLKPTIQSNFTTFLHVSTLDMVNKNPEGIISGVELLVKNGHENFRLRIVSDEDFSLLENMVKNKDLSHFIQFYGPCKPEELVQHYHESDAFVFQF
jgi:glycosyltransferase involved in cell wall biosynthesis